MELLKNISQITNPELDLRSMSVLGVKLGDSLDSILPQIISEVPHAGWFHIDKSVAIRTSEREPKIVVEFILRPEVLGDLKLTKKKEIQRRFGKALAIEQQHGSTYYFYISQKIVINWNNSNDQLVGIYIGENVIKQTEFRIKDFLEKYYEFKTMVPNYNEWNASSLKYNKPRYYRLKELESLMFAFDIGSDLLKDFQKRRFLKRRKIEDFKPIIYDIEEYVNNTKFEKERCSRKQDTLNDTHQLGMLIQIFMRFSEEMRSILRFNDGWLATGSVISRYSIYKTQKLLSNINLKELDKIEFLLGKLIDPKERVFTKSELISNYNFPDVDLYSIDMDSY